MADTQTPPFDPDDTIELTLKSSNYWAVLVPLQTYLRAYFLEGETFSFGRNDDCNCSVRCTEISKYVSKRHFEINRESDGRVYIEDRSKFGTYVNDEQISKKRLLNDDTISVLSCNRRVFMYKEQFNENLIFLPHELKETYEVSKELGRGSYGTVRLVYDKKTYRPYAIKKMATTNSDNEEEILKSLEHPFIVRFKNSVRTSDFVYIIMEYLADGNLETLMRERENRSFNERHLKFIFIQVFTAVWYLHKNQIIHRDIKPQNILWKRSRQDLVFKITDFGLSKLLTNESTTMTNCGTDIFKAPEMFCYIGYDYKVDVYSLGVLLYYMLFGDISSSQEIATFNADETSDCEDLIQKMTVASPSERISMDDIWNHPWIGKDEDTQRKLNEVMADEWKTLNNDF